MSDKLGDPVRLYHILDAIIEIETYIQDVSRDVFWADSMRYNATLHQLAIIGEAATRLSDEVKQANPTVDWRNIIGLRNLIVHQYFGIDDLLIWTIIQTDIPDLKPQIQAILAAI